MRATLSALLVDAAQGDPNIVVLNGDHGYSLFDDLSKTCPEQCLNCGVAEQNMVGVAAGLAKGGFRPIVYGLAAFVPIRVLEQIKIDVCYEDLPVIFLGDGAGFVYSTLGSSHQCFEDIAALRAMPNIGLFSPADRFELAWCFAQARQASGPSYIRLGKADLGDVHPRALTEIVAGSACAIFEDGAETLCLAAGSMVSVAKRAIERGRLGCDLYSFPRLQPIEPSLIRQLCAGRRRIVVAEEHSVYGGLGSIVAEAIAGAMICEFEIVGLRDTFVKDCGSYAELLARHDLDELSLLNRLRSRESL